MGPRANAENVSVATDVSKLSDEGFERLGGLRLEERLVLRLVQEGFAVIGIGDEPDIQLVFEEVDALVLRVKALAHGKEHSRLIDVSNIEDTAALHLEIAQRSVELARQLVELRTEIESVPDTAPLQRGVVVKPMSDTPSQDTLAVDVATGGLYRGDSDLQFRVGLRYGLWKRIEVGVLVGVMPANEEGIDVLEWQAQAGASLILASRNNSQLRVGIDLGVLVHHFQLSNESGARADPLVSFPVTLSHSIGSLGLLFQFVPGFTTQSRRHTQGTQEIWSRSSSQLGVLMGLTIAL